MIRQSLTLLAVASTLTFGLAAPASAVVTQFSTNLTNALEPDPTSPGTGTALVTLDSLLNTVAVHLDFSGLSANASAGHIHCCTAVAGAGSSGVAIGFSSFPAVKSGSYDNVFSLSAGSFGKLC